MSKKIKFTPNLVPLILSGSKTSTWRLWDDKDLRVDDILDFFDSQTDNKFATAQVTNVTQKTFKEIVDSDFKTHESYKDSVQMYKTYQDYYQKPVLPDTPVKIINFKLFSQ